MKQTAVEWLVKKLSYETSEGTIISHHFIINKLFEQAKAMEKEQIENAFNYGQFDLGMEADEYYNEIYKSE